MKRPESIVLTCAIALMAGCATNKSTTKPSARAHAQPHNSMAASSAAPTTAPAAAAPAVAPDNLAGAWQLAMPRRNQQHASITATDATHVTIKAGENLSGDYVVQGRFLLIITRDEKLRPLAWRVNSLDSLTVIRSLESGAVGSDYTVRTLLRAA